MSYEILQYSTVGSLIIQFITGLLGAYGLKIPLAGKDIILKQVLGLEMLVQGIEFVFYMGFLSAPSIASLTISRYHDWVLSTPIMLFTTALYFFYVNFIEQNGGEEIIDLEDFVKDHWKVISAFVILNFLMLLFGYLGELGVINKMAGFWLGTAALFGSFGTIYYEFAQQSEKTTKLFWIMFSIWSVYGVAYLLKPIYKNIGYTVLDLFAKHLIGVFLTYISAEKQLSP
jgi:hypothetical protein